MKAIMENWRAFRRGTILKEHDTGIRKQLAKKARTISVRDNPHIDIENSPFYNEALNIIADVRINLQKEFIRGRRKEALIKFIYDKMLTDWAADESGFKKEYPTEEKLGSFVAEHYDKAIHPVLHAAIANTPVRFGSQLERRQRSFGSWTTTDADDDTAPLSQRAATSGYGRVKLNLEWFLHPGFGRVFTSEQERKEVLAFTVYHELNHMIDFIWASDRIIYPGQSMEPREEDRLLSTQQSHLIQKLYEKVLATSSLELHQKMKDSGIEPEFLVDPDPDEQPPYLSRPWEAWAFLLEMFKDFPEGLTTEDLKKVCEWRDLRKASRHDDLDTATALARLEKQLNDRGWADGLLYHNHFITYLKCEELTKELVDELNKDLALFDKENRKIQMQLPQRTSTAE